MGQEVLGGVAARTVAATSQSVAAALVAPPSPPVVAAVYEASWPMDDPESLRARGLLAESRLSGERLERLVADYSRLFVGGPDRPPVTSGPPPAAAVSLTRLRGEVTAAGAVAPAASAPGLGQALQLLSAVLGPHPSRSEAAQQRRELLTEHLLPWGAARLSRVQLGAQTLYFQGVATLGLCLLRWAERTD